MFSTPLLFGETAGHIRMNGTAEEPQPDIPGCTLQSAKSQVKRDAMGDSVVLSDLTVFVPPGHDVRSGDRLLLRGVTWTVEGEPLGDVSAFTGHSSMVPVAVRRYGG